MEKRMSEAPMIDENLARLRAIATISTDTAGCSERS
jgi:hypothetical protein